MSVLRRLFGASSKSNPTVREARREPTGSGGLALYLPAGGSLRPASLETVKERMHYVRQDGQTVFKFAVRGMAEISQDILDRNKLEISDIKLYIPHQANLRIIQGAVERMRLKESQVAINIDRYANTVAATIPLGRLGDQMELGNLVAFLASQQASYITGAVYQVDGGLTRSNT